MKQIVGILMINLIFDVVMVKNFADFKIIKISRKKVKIDERYDEIVQKMSERHQETMK